MKIKSLLLFFFIFSISLFAAEDTPLVNLSVAAVEDPTQFVKTINIAIILMLFVLAPTLLLMVTSFTRLIFMIINKYSMEMIILKNHLMVINIHYLYG